MKSKRGIPSRARPQIISKLRKEFQNGFFDINKIITLFKELFEILVAETTAQACMEVDDLCTEIYIKDELYWKLPDRLRDIIFYSITLHDWPSKFCMATPSELFEDINELYNELPYRIMRIYKIHIENFRNIKNITLNYKKNRWFVEKEDFDFSIILSALNLALGEKFYKITKDDFYKCNERNIIKINLYFNNFAPEDVEAIKKEITHHVETNGIYYTYIEIHKELELKREVRWEVKIYPNLAREQKLYIGELHYAYFSNKLKRILKEAIYDAYENIVLYSKVIVRKKIDVYSDEALQNYYAFSRINSKKTIDTQKSK